MELLYLIFVIVNISHSGVPVALLPLLTAVLRLRIRIRKHSLICFRLPGIRFALLFVQ